MLRSPTAFVIIMVVSAMPSAEAGAASFDGAWTVTQACEAAPDGARAFKWIYDATVKQNYLVGQYGTKDKPSSLTLTGTIRADGTANLEARGLVGKSDYTLGFGNPGDKFFYRVDARFAASKGSGLRTAGRTCSFTFMKK